MSEDDAKGCAAQGAGTFTTYAMMGGEQMSECVSCGMQVRWDMVDHPFFGFAASCEKPKAETPNGQTAE